MNRPEVLDNGGRRHSHSAALSNERRIHTDILTESLSSLNVSESIEQIDDYFENTETRTRAWLAAGKNLQMKQNNIVSPMPPTEGFQFPIYVVEFKAGRTDFFYSPSDAGGPFRTGDLVIVEADRGKDLGKIIEDNINTLEELQVYQSTHENVLVDPPGSNTNGGQGKDPVLKRLFRRAERQEVSLLLAKNQDEKKAVGVCQVRIRQKKLPMEVVDAEYQWDRRKLTFYFVADRRIDFRELVRELFKIYKTRIWM